MAVLLLCVVLGLGGCGSVAEGGLTRFSYSQIHMGSRARVVLYAPDEAQARTAARAAFARLAVLDGVMSDYRQDSEISHVCAQPAGVWTPISEDLFLVLTRAGEISELTGGAFDCTVGPLSRLWRRARLDGALPAAQDLAAARERVGWRLVHLDRQRRAVMLGAEGMVIDFGGIGKGYAADRVIEVMRAMGVRRCLLDFGGDLAAGDPPPGEAAWQVEIEAGYGRGPNPMVRLANAGVATSGDTEQYVEVEGRRYSHILDPATGLGLTTRSAATVVAPDGATADALASAACVLGPERAAEILGGMPGVGVLMMVDGEDRGFGPRKDLIEAGR